MANQIREFRVPELGENVASADVLRVLVEEGDLIAAEQPVVEVETDKAIVEIPCPLGGRVIGIHIQAGQRVGVGAPLITVEVKDARAKETARMPDQRAVGTNNMRFQDYAHQVELLINRAQILDGTKTVKNELYPLIFFFTVNWTKCEDPAWLAELQAMFERKSGKLRQDFVARLAAYDASANKSGGGGPLWFVSRAFYTLATGQDVADLDVIVPLSIELGACLTDSRKLLFP